MQPALIVGIEVCGQPLARCSSVPVRVQIHRFVLDRAPQPFEEDVVDPAAQAVQADAAACGLEPLDPVLGGERATWIGIEDLRHPEARQRLLQGCQAEVGRQGVGKPPGQHIAAGDVQDRHQVQKPVRHRQVGDIRGPHLIRPLNTLPLRRYGRIMAPRAGRLVRGLR